MLQRLVAYVASTGALLIAGVNFIALLHLYQRSPLDAFLSSTVVFLVGFAIAFLASAYLDSPVARALQVVVFLLGGLYIAINSATGNLTSAVFVLFSMVLLNEYTSANRAAIISLLFGIVYVVMFAVGIGARTASVALSVLITMILLSAVIVLFGLISYRQHQIRKEHESMLERLVAERTSELQEALVQRDTMLQEIHHRVGNSLQLLSSFISLQQDEVEDEQRQILKETELRVHAIADVHATLYSQHQLSHLPLAMYAGDLISDMQIAYRSEADITASISADIEAHIDFAISFGVILNELVTNAAKHGGAPAQRSRVEVELDDSGRILRLVVRDHGAGFDAAGGTGVGTEVVEQLVQQNKGEIVRRSDSGAVVVVSFPHEAVVRDRPLRVGQTAHSAGTPVPARST